MVTVVLWGGLGWLLFIVAALLVGWRVASYRKYLAAREAARFGLEPADIWWAGDPQ